MKQKELVAVTGKSPRGCACCRIWPNNKMKRREMRRKEKMDLKNSASF